MNYETKINHMYVEKVLTHRTYATALMFFVLFLFVKLSH